MFLAIICKVLIFGFHITISCPGSKKEDKGRQWATHWRKAKGFNYEKEERTEEHSTL